MYNDYKDFIKRFKILISKNPKLIKHTLTNIFTMRMIGNKTHGDLAEIAIAEFINQYMYDYTSEHIGKQKYRAKEVEEDVKVINEINKKEFLISIKAYGHGPLQLSTDKEYKLFPFLESKIKPRKTIDNKNEIQEILNSESFSMIEKLNVLSLIYDEENRKCNIIVFDFDKAKEETSKIELEEVNKQRKYPVFKFYNDKGGYIFEVRYGGKDANALQRGLWTHTERASEYFDSLTNGWIDYSDNEVLVKMFRYALISSQDGHEKALEILNKDIEKLKNPEVL